MLQHRMTHATLGEVLRWRAQTQPERSAFTFLADGENLEQQISYAGLDRQARAIAATLQEQGFAGERTLLLYPAGLSFLAAFMGCIYARVTAIPVPAHFQDPTRLQRTLPRLRAIAADAGASLVLTVPEMLAQTGLILEQAPDLGTLRWLDTEAIPLLLAEAWQPPEIQPDDLVFLQYSSGSTGLPKGVMVSHANLMHNLAAISHAFGHSEASTGVSWLPAYHDMGLVADVLQPLYAGFHQVFMSPFDFIRRPLRWLEAISRYHASTSGAPNFAYALCAAKVQEEELAALDLSAWEIAYNCAEPVSAEAIERFAATFAACGFRRRAFFPYLGMAEATLMVSAGAKDAEPVFLPVSRAALLQGRIETVASGTAASGTAQDARRFVGCGKSLPDQRLAIVDPQTRRACAEKQIGEIWVSGPSVAQGYWNRPEENRELFEARLADTGEGPFMRTGDLGFLADGELFITGRLKDLIIIQGQNHYPQDIESTVDAAHPLIRPGCCAAFALGDGPEELVVVAELLPDSPFNLPEAERKPLLKRIAASIQGELFAAHQLAAGRIVLIEAGTIPKTSSGKIQRKACKEALLRHELRTLAELGRNDLEQDPPASGDIPTGTALEDILCGLFADILGLERVGPQERFLDLGGHSLLATRLVSRIRESLGVELPLRLLFETPTVAGLAARIASLEGQPLPPIQALSPAAPLRLSYAQERMWFMDQLQPDSAIYNIPTLIRLEGLLDAPSLEKGFQTLIGRHASLRTRFESRADQVFQIVDAQSDFRLEIVDLCDLADAETEARSLAQAEAHAPFDLAHGPLIRARLLKIRSDLHLLVLNLHHIISDGWSQGLLLQELAACYAAFCQGEAVVLPELPVQYADYAHWQRQNFEGEAFQTQLSYWKGRLADAPARLQLPTDRPRPAVESYQGASFSFRCERALTEALLVLARCEDVTLFMLLLAAFQVLLHRYSRQGDICVGIPIANRRMREIEPLIGFFVNTLVIRGDLQAEPAFRDFLRQIKARCLDAYAHQDLPFEKLVEELNPERSLSHHPLFQVMFVIQDAAMASLQLPGLESSRAELSGPVSKFDLTLELIPELIPGHDGLSGRIEYNRDLFDDTTIARLAGHYIQLLQAIVGQPETPVGSLPLLTEAERRQLLVDWNDTSTKYQRDAWVHRLFEEQTARTPDRTALLWADQRLSYRELNEKANQLAHFLHGQGLGPGMLAGICLERSPDLIAGLLAILKLGAAYVPIDPDYPADRIAWILADAAPALVLSRQSLATRHGLSGLVVDLDAQDVEIARQPLNSPEFTPGELSHVIYTSGSTGRPKGVAIRHSSTTALCQWALGVYSTEELRGVLASTSICFDLSVFEIFVPLSGGGSVVLVQDILELPSCTARSEISLINTVPSAIAQVLKLGAIPASVRTINLAGEPLKTELVSQLYRRTSATKVYDLYGPSEDTTYSTFVLRAPDRPPSIGRPIANTRVYLLDQQLNPVPIGVPGELHLGGAGLAQGYLNRPELTAEKFIPDPFGPSDQAERLYKTGDLARYLPDGKIEFLGRIDHQVKLRGFRIELGEIEAVLGQQPDVKEAVVLCRGEAEHKSLIAYLVPDTSAASAEIESEQVEQWQALYQETYSQDAAAEPGSDFKGWNSSYTGQPIPIDEMRQWRDATVERILSFKPAKAYEIGCGTGLLLSQIAPSCESYLASDFSAAVVEAVSVLKRQLPGLDRVEALQRRADDFNGIAPQAFDTVIINSVVQYFPSAAYLLEVLRQATEATASGGRIFIGDVRNLDLLQAFHASIALAKAQGQETLLDLHRQVLLQAQREEELCLAPGFFLGLPALIPGIRQVEVLHKRGRFRNELNCFRYDVILHLGEAPVQTHPVSWLDWESSFSLENLPSMYAKSPGIRGIRNIPNARVRQAVQARELLARAGDQAEPDSLTALHETLEKTDAFGYDPEDFWQLGETLNCRVKVCVSPVSDCFSVVFSQQAPFVLSKHSASKDKSGNNPLIAVSSPTSLRDPPYGLRQAQGERNSLLDGKNAQATLIDLANQPVRGKVSARLVPRLKAALAEKLPEYMIPGRFVILDRFPLTPNGKIDRKALPDPDQSREQAGSDYVGPSTPEQSLLCELFAEVLELDRVGIYDNFFELGGHSLLATQLAARIRERLEVELPLRRLFEAPTVAGLAEGIQELRGQTGQALPAMQTVSHPGPTRLSCAQERMWFMDQLQPDSALYNIQLAFRLKGTLDANALENAFQVLIRRHASLRTRFESHADQVFQVIDTETAFRLEIMDYSQLPDPEAEAFTQARTEAHTPFNLSTGPLIRVRLLKTAADMHLLVMNLHHIVSDGWSLGLLLQELEQVYQGFCKGEAVALPNLTHQYADYADWQSAYFASESFRTQLGYWKQQLAQAPALLQLPYDRPRPAIESYHGARAPFAYDRNLTEALLALAQREGVTPFMLLLAAFQVLLHRYSHQGDICVGIPIANRRLRQVEPIVGLFVNTLVIRGDLEAGPRFRDFLQQIKTRCLDAYAHQDLPFEKLVEELNPERSLSHHPLFQVMFALQDAAGASLTLAGLEASRHEPGGELSKFDLSLDLTLKDACLAGRIEYNRDLFDATTMTRLLGHFEQVLQAIVAQPETPVGSLPLLTQAERRQLLFDWNQTGKEYPKDKCIHQFFEAQAAAAPERIAAVYEDQQLSYGELNEKANQLAHYLRAKGVGPDVLVGLCMERSIEMIVALLGLLKAGGAYVALDPGYPRERVLFMLQDAGAKLVLVQASTAALFAGEAEVILLETDAEAWQDQPVTNPDSGVGLDHLISIIYTSGSTGKPKGVMNRHLGVYNHLVYRQSAYQMGPDDRIMQKTSINFDGSVWELFWPLMVGARLCVARPAGHKDSYYLCDFIAQHGITMIDFVPSMLQEFLNGPPLEKCHSLRRIFVGGEGLSWQLQQEYFSKLKIALTHGYGPTETTVSVLYWECSPDSPLRTVPIGRPIANTRLYILDSGLNPVPIGVAGELHIGGDGLARGYLHRPELTAERFIPNPFGPPDRPERLYKSGDLARYLPDGNVEFLGRVDQQVKIRGFRIELGEIETLLSQHPAIQDVVVIAREDRPGDRRLVAYLVAPARPRLGELRAHLKSRLPEYMVPAAFVFLDKIPLTHNQKIDRRALPAPEANPQQTRLQADTDYVAPTSPQEAALCELFAQVLKIDRVGIHDKFFDLGGHSLLATRLVSMIRERLRVELPLRALFEAPTPAELAACVVALEAQTSNDMRDDMRIQRVSRAEPLRLSFAQERLWFMDQLEPDSALYNIPMALRLEGRLDASALEKSFTTLIARHESLRTRFASRAGQAVQLIGEPFAFKLEIVDLSGQANPEAEALDLARADAYAPFDLSAGPLLRARLLKLSGTMHLLVLNLHHIISDGWSWRVMMQELEQSYAGFCLGEAVDLPELPVQYADFAHWQREWFQSEVFRTQLDYWKQQLANAPVLLQLPTDRPRPAIDSYRGARVTFRYEPELMTALQNMAQREGVTLFMLLLAAFQVLMHRYSQQNDICVGIPIANRRLQEVEPLIGFFVNTLVIRGDFQGEPAFRDFLGQIKERCLGAYAHQDLPFEKLVEELNPKRSLSHHPLFQVLFVLQEVAPEAFALTGLQTRAEDLGSRLSRFDLAMELIPGENGLTARIEYSRDLFDDTTIVRLVGHYECLLRSVLLQPEAAVASLPLLPESERRQLLSDWNDTETEFRHEACIHQLFEEQAARTPDQIALVFEDQQLNYRELNQKANQLAHHLRAQGVGPEMLVGICLERSLEMVVTLLAILKAGGAYVPLDPTYPAERLAFLLEDARVGLLVTQSGLLQQLPEHTAKVLCLDNEGRIFASADRQNPPLTVRPDQLAYVIYTSGSTGRPKGAMIEHRGLCNLVRAQQLAYGLTADDRVLQHASLSFDASIFEMLLALCAGARLCLGKKEDLLGPALHRFISRHGLTVINLPPSALAVLPPLPTNSTLKSIIVAGEACPTSLAESWSQGCRFFNAYGPTEATVWSSVAEFRPGDSQLTIGRPIANTRLYILDAELNPVPIGVPGELYIGGAGLARGYLNRPELTAEKFIPAPFGPPDRPEQLYKSGDLARYLPDGNVEFLGRIDHQVKLRGFRIELGEIEALLVQHPDVRDAVVLCRGEAEHKSLIAYLVPDTSTSSEEIESEQVEQWQALYQETYSQDAVAAPGSDFKGWNSSYTGQPIAIDEMRQWRDATVERILSFKPAKAYEIGCGTGLLLSKIAPSCESYLASDFSAAVVEAVSDLKHRLPGLDRVETLQRRANDFTGITPQAFDTVIINSVIQYFPSAAYLLEVLRQAVEATTSNGRIFIGDVRNLDLLQAFHASIALAKAQGTESSAEIHQQVQLRVQREEELCLAPGFFYSLPALIPGICQVEVLHKRGRFRNELNCFRYDVILHLGAAPVQNQPVSWLDWGPTFSLKALPAMYAQSPGILGLRNIPNARVQQAVQASELLTRTGDRPEPDSLTALHETLKQWDASGYEPEDFWQLGETLNCRVKICVSEVPDCFSVLLSQTDMLDVFQNAMSEDFTPDALMSLANHPARGKLSARLVPRLKAALAKKLPEYMVPGRFVILDRFPLTPNGKVDRKALPDPDKSREQAGSDYVAPSTPEQSLLCGLFAEVLELDRVGIHDNFFDLGGHSLLATQLAARIRERLQVELPLRKLFEAPTVAELAASVQELRGQTLARIAPAPKGIPLRLSLSQELWWFLFPRRADLEHGIQNSYAGIRLAGELDVPALEQSLQQIIARHESLRTTFAKIETRPVRVVHPKLPFRLACRDLTDLDQAQAIRQLQQEAELPFNLETGPLIRATLYKVSARMHFFMFSVSHIVFDGWSLKIMLKELDSLYSGFASGRDADLPPLPVQYSDYVHWHRGWIKKTAMKQQLFYWLMKGRNMPVVLDLPTDKPRPRELTMNGGSVGFVLDEALTGAVRELARREGVTAYMVLLAAFQVLLHQYSGQTDIFVGTPVANRRAQETESLIGLFLNFIVLRGDLSGQPRFCDYLQQVRETCLGAYAHQDLPFQFLLKSFKAFKVLTTFRSFKTERTLRSNVMFNLLDDFTGDFSLGPLRASMLPLETHYSSQVLHMILSRSGQGLEGQLIYSADLFEKATVVRLTEHYRRLLELVLSDPGVPVSQHPQELG